MLKEIRKLDFKCNECNSPAIFELTRTNEDLPDGYMKDGTRMETYCKKHLPAEAKGMWEDAL